MIGEIRRRRAGRHVARVLLVAGRIGDDEFAPRGGEIAIGDVDRDSLLAFGAQAVREQRKIDQAGRAIDLALLHRSELIFVNALGVVQQPADQRRFAVVHAAGGRETQQILLQFLLQERVESFSRSRMRWTLEIALPLLDLHRAFFVVIDGAVFAFGSAERNHLLDDFRQRVGLGANGAGARNATERAHAALHQPRFLRRIAARFDRGSPRASRCAAPLRALWRSKAARSEYFPRGCRARRRAPSSSRAGKRGCSRTLSMRELKRFHSSGR